MTVMVGLLLFAGTAMLKGTVLIVAVQLVVINVTPVQHYWILWNV